MISIKLTDSTAAVTGTYSVSAVFSVPGVFTFPLGLTLTVISGCATSTFPSAPVLSSTQDYYYVGASSGQGDISVAVSWTQDTFSTTKGTAYFCPTYTITPTLNVAQSTITATIDSA